MPGNSSSVQFRVVHCRKSQHSARLFNIGHRCLILTSINDIIHTAQDVCRASVLLGIVQNPFALPWKEHQSFSPGPFTLKVTRIFS